MNLPIKTERYKLWRELKRFQSEHFTWLSYNFPKQKPHDGLLGLAEEVGELCHAHLKRDQGIRGLSEEEYREQAEDAVGDIFIYLMSYCNTNNIDLSKSISRAWAEVKSRDWIKYPEKGRP